MPYASNIHTRTHRIPRARQVTRVVALLFVLSLVGCSTLLVDSYNYGTIDVTVLLESGEPAPDIPLVLYRDDEILAYGSTNGAGQFSFNFVPFGVVGVYVQLAPQYETAASKPSDHRDNINLSDGGRISLLFSDVRAAGSSVGSAALEVRP